ncbi:MAG: hypothetical protein IJO69_01045 [Ruminiclostridium sp.]|nr:hypothetical protein [Ruminiclostridium sp.]MBQ9932403.1 hypothetical protein [Ruminiclostridium sp.]
MKKEIQVQSYVRQEGRLIPVEDLPSEKRELFAVWLKSTYLNELFRGAGRVFPEKEKT